MGFLQNEYDVGAHFPDGLDPEKGGGPPTYTDAPAVSGETFITGDTTYAKIQRAVSKFGVEPRGIERVPEDERTDTNLMKVGTMVSSTEPRKKETGQNADVRLTVAVRQHGCLLLRHWRIGHPRL